MRIRHAFPLAGIALAAACATSGSSASTPSDSPSPAVSPSPDSAAPSTAGASWQGDLRPEGGSSTAGTVTITPAATGNQSTAVITLTGGTPNGTHPWHVHMGSCAEKGAVVGAPAAYTPLTTDATGAARLEVTLPFTAPATGTYSVNVHMSPSQMGKIVSCADLRTK